jgi:hypothetical protein
MFHMRILVAEDEGDIRGVYYMTLVEGTRSCSYIRW